MLRVAPGTHSCSLTDLGSFAARLRRPDAGHGPGWGQDSTARSSRSALPALPSPPCCTALGGTGCGCRPAGAHLDGAPADLRDADTAGSDHRRGSTGTGTRSRSVRPFVRARYERSVRDGTRKPSTPTSPRLVLLHLRGANPMRSSVHSLAGQVGRVGAPARAQLRSGGEVLVQREGVLR